MNLQGILTVLVAGACILAIGVASNSLDAVETDPSDVIDTSQIPTQDNQPKGGAELVPEEGEQDAGTEQTTGSPDEEAGGGTPDLPGNMGAGGMMSIWDLLERYLPYILGGLAAIAGVVGAYILYKRRFTGQTGPAEITYEVDTSNEVYECWWNMVEMADVDDPITKTPQEFAEAAVDEGLDPDGVSELTRLFEEALYGGKEVTNEEERLARDAIERIKSKGKEAA